MKGKFHADLGQIREGWAEYEHVLRKINAKDSFAKLGIANMNYSQSNTMRGMDINKQEEYLRRAMGLYFEILECDEANCFGVLGIGNILAEYGKVHEAKEIYKLLEQNASE